MADPNTDVKGGGNDFLRSQGIEVLCGVKEREALRINENFVKFALTKRPFVVLKMAATLDGRIATRTGDSHWVTGEAAREVVHQMRHAMDAIMVGVGTVTADDPELTARPAAGRGADPIRLVLDSRLTMSKRARMLNQTSNVPTFVVCGPHASEMDRRRLSTSGARILQMPLKKDRIDLNALMEQLGRMNVTSLLIEGGAQVAAGALSADIVDKVVIFYAPKILGGDDGVPICRGVGPAFMKDALALQDMSVQMVGEDVMVQGYRKKDESG
jgi:diaminohydroxyphosphoribosylaminopyrimidine deaminase / 5-amino-6-(5-phosphoribosylamino)uracil reductase